MVEQQEGLLGLVPLKHVARLVQLDMRDVLWWSPELVLPWARGREQRDLLASLQLCLDALVEVSCHQEHLADGCWVLVAMGIGSDDTR